MKYLNIFLCILSFNLLGVEKIGTREISLDLSSVEFGEGRGVLQIDKFHFKTDGIILDAKVGQFDVIKNTDFLSIQNESFDFEADIKNVSTLQDIEYFLANNLTLQSSVEKLFIKTPRMILKTQTQDLNIEKLLLNCENNETKVTETNTDLFELCLRNGSISSSYLKNMTVKESLSFLNNRKISTNLIRNFKISIINNKAQISFELKELIWMKLSGTGLIQYDRNNQKIYIHLQSFYLGNLSIRAAVLEYLKLQHIPKISIKKDLIEIDLK